MSGRAVSPKLSLLLKRARILNEAQKGQSVRSVAVREADALAIFGQHFGAAWSVAQDPILRDHTITWKLPGYGGLSMGAYSSSRSIECPDKWYSSTDVIIARVNGTGDWQLSVKLSIPRMGYSSYDQASRSDRVVETVAEVMSAAMQSRSALQQESMFSDMAGTLIGIVHDWGQERIKEQVTRMEEGITIMKEAILAEEARMAVFPSPLEALASLNHARRGE